jgi:urea transport system substrate-binding protein
MTPGNPPDPSTPAKSGESAPPAELGETAFVGPDTPANTPRLVGGSGMAQAWIGKVLGKYQVTGVLGQGGMGVVLKAHDPMIERDVAIKVLADHLAADDTALGRFLAEAKAAGKLNHPNVIAIYEICQEGQTYYLVLEYAPGGSLSDRLAGGEPLSVLEATQALIDACKGVGAAHAAGLIHRDIKPANFMRAVDGSIKVADFGLAKAATDTGRHLTQAGLIVGTPYFMSPEQCEAKPLDHRSDLYSLGATYYCLLSGKHPYHETDSLPQLLYMHCHGPIPDPRSVNPAVPEACSRIIARAMAKSPGNRYASTEAMRADLAAVAATLSGQTLIPLPSESGTRLAATNSPFLAPSPLPVRRRQRLAVGIAAGILVLAIAAGIAFRLARPISLRDPADTTGQGLRVLAVLPFLNTAADKETEYLCDGIPCALLKKFSEIQQLTVRPYRPGQKKPNEDADPRELGRRLEAEAVLIGRFHQNGDRLLVSVELISVRDNQVIWVEQYERRLTDLQEVESDVTRHVCGRLGLSLSSQEERSLARRDTTEPEAHQLYLQGLYHSSQSTLEGMRKSLGYFKAAIAKDPNYALAHSGLADTYGYYAGDWLPYEEALPLQKVAARKALELDDGLAEAHLAMGNVFMGQDNDWSAAERELKRAIELKPRLDAAHDAYAQLLAFQGRFEESLAQQQEALKISPRSPALITNRSYLLYLQRRYDQAIEQARQALEIDPTYVVAHDYLGAAYLQKRQFKEALREIRRCRQLDDVPWYLARLAAAQALAGNPGEARNLLKELQEMSKRRYVTPECFFVIHAGLGDTDQAFAWLERMYEVRSQFPLRLQVDPGFDSLRADPRFADWLRRLKLAPGAAVLALGGGSVKVGVLHSMTGTMATSGMSVVDATLFALDEVNQAGGVLGRPIKPVIVDGRSDWPTFAREAERLITQEKVCTVFGCWTSAGRKSVKPVFEAHDHLLIYPVQYEGLETSPCIVYLGAAPNQQILPAIEWAVKTLQKKRFFLVGSDYVFPRAAHAIIKDQLKRLGAEVVGEEYVRLGSQKVETVVNAVARAKPDMILNTINGDSNTAFFRALRVTGIKPADAPTLSFSIGEQELRSLNSADVTGDYAAWTYFQSVATPENEEFVRRFHEKNPQRSITDPMETAYIGVKLWAKAANEAQSLDPKKIRRTLLNQSLKGPDGEVRIDPDTQHCYRTPRIGQIQADGQFKIVWTAPEPVRPEPYPNSRTAEAWRAFLHDLYTGWGNRWAAPDK